MNELPGWMPYLSAPLNLMHNLFLGEYYSRGHGLLLSSSIQGIVRHLWVEVIIDGYLFNIEESHRFNVFLDHMHWPSGIGRVPKNVSGCMRYSTSSNTYGHHLLV